jgi:transposase InsO family protein
MASTCFSLECCRASVRGRLDRPSDVATLMRRMGIAAIYRRPNTSKPEPGHKIYPYLLRGMKIEQVNQVWAMDITYVPMARGFVYLERFSFTLVHIQRLRNSLRIRVG